MSIVLCFEKFSVGSLRGVETFGLDTVPDDATARASMVRAFDMAKPVRGLLLTARKGSETGHPILLGRVIRIRPLTVAYADNRVITVGSGGYGNLTDLDVKRPEGYSSHAADLALWPTDTGTEGADRMFSSILRFTYGVGPRLARLMLEVMEITVVGDLIGKRMATKDMRTVSEAMVMIREASVGKAETDRSRRLEVIANLKAEYLSEDHIPSNLKGRALMDRRNATDYAIESCALLLEVIYDPNSQKISDWVFAASRMASQLGYESLVCDKFREWFTWPEMILRALIEESQKKRR